MPVRCIFSSAATVDLERQNGGAAGPKTHIVSSQGCPQPSQGIQTTTESKIDSVVHIRSLGTKICFASVTASVDACRYDRARQVRALIPTHGQRVRRRESARPQWNDLAGRASLVGSAASVFSRSEIVAVKLSRRALSRSAASG